MENKQLNDQQRSKTGARAGLVGILCNLGLFGIKLAAGVLSGAVSIVADALNNLSDVASSVATMMGFRLAQRPADRDHPYGHARYEYLSGLVVAALILVIGFEMAGNALRKIITPVPVHFTWLSAMILLVSILIKVFLSFYYFAAGKKLESTVLKATAVDCRNDVVTTVAILLGCLAERFFNWQIDGFMGMGVALFILYSGICVGKETLDPLLGQRADPRLVENISKIVLSHEKVLGIHDLLVHDYGPGRCYASVHVEISATEDPLSCHDVIDHIENEVLEEENVRLVIHYDPVLENDEEWNKMRQFIEEIVAQMDQNMTIHDFRIVRGSSQPKLVFDLAVPYGTTVVHRQIKEYVLGKLQENGHQYKVKIRYDNED